MTSIPPLNAAAIPSDHHPDAVVIGGGPVGLWTAIQLRLRSAKEVTVVEKYEAYQRANIRLRINAASLKGIPKDSGLEKIVKEWEKGPVPIAEMENALTARAHELGIKILKGYQAEPETLSTLFPTAKVFVGADGAHSAVRTTVFNDEFRFRENLQYMAQVEYVVTSNKLSHANKLFGLSETYKMRKFAEHVVIQTTRPQADDSPRVTLQIFIDKATYDKMADASFKNPYYFETDLDKVPDALRTILIKWWGGRNKFHDEQISVEAGKANKMTVIPLNCYAAKYAVKDYQGKKWVLVGDSIAAFPFFRAANTGFMLGTKLADSLARGLKKPSTLSSQLNSYSRYVTRRIWIERIRAWVNNLFLHLSKLWLYASNHVPWQSVKLDYDTKDEITQRGEAAWDRFAGRATSS